MAPLSLVELRSLARMFRQGVEGAKDNLEVLARERVDELAELLRVPAAKLRHVLDADNLAALVATAIEHTARLRRDALIRSRRESARGLAETLCKVSERRDDGSIALHAALLGEILFLWGPGWLVLGSWGSVGAARLRAILRECRGVTSRAVVATNESVLVFYETACSRGMIRLHLHPVVADADALHVPIDTVPMSVVDTHVTAEPAKEEPVPPEPAPLPIDTAEPPAPVAPVAGPVRRATGRRRRFVRIVEAALSLAIGAQP